MSDLADLLKELEQVAKDTNLKAVKKKPLEEVLIDSIDIDELGLTKEGLGSEGSRIKVDSIEIPVIKRSLKILKGGKSDMVQADEVQKASDDLVKLLREEAKII